MQETYEGAEPSANAIAVRNCLRFASLLGNEEDAKQARQTLSRYANHMQHQPQALPTMINSVFLSTQNAPSVVIAEGKNAKELRTVFHHLAIPGSTLLTVSEKTASFLKAPWLVAMKNRDGDAQAFVCEGKSCKAPTTEPEKLRDQLEAAMNRLQKTPEN